MNFETFQLFEQQRDVLVSLRPIFYNFKETLLLVEEKDINSFEMLMHVFFKVNNKHVKRHYPEDLCVCVTKNGPKYFPSKEKYRYFFKIVKPELIYIVNNTENLEKEIQNVENKMKDIQISRRNSYILFLLSIKKS